MKLTLTMAAILAATASFASDRTVDGCEVIEIKTASGDVAYLNKADPTCRYINEPVNDDVDDKVAEAERLAD